MIRARVVEVGSGFGRMNVVVEVQSMALARVRDKPFLGGVLNIFVIVSTLRASKLSCHHEVQSAGQQNLTVIARA